MRNQVRRFRGCIIATDSVFARAKSLEIRNAHMRKKIFFCLATGVVHRFVDVTHTNVHGRSRAVLKAQGCVLHLAEVFQQQGLK
jgi:hypothetical protein